MPAAEKNPVTRGRRWLLGLLVVYILGLHAIVIVAIFKTDILLRASARLGLRSDGEFTLDSRAFRSAHFLLDRVDQMMRKSPVIFLGDSIIEGLLPLNDVPRLLNLGLGGNTILRTTAMIASFPSFDQIAAAVLSIGINDLCSSTHPSNQEFELRLRKLLASLPSGVPIVWSSILPVDPNAPDAVCTVQPDAIKQANLLIAGLCKNRVSCIYSDGFSKLADKKGYLAPEFHDGDGVHLSRRGYEVWSAQLRRDFLQMGLSKH